MMKKVYFPLVAAMLIFANSCSPTVPTQKAAENDNKETVSEKTSQAPQQTVVSADLKTYQLPETDGPTYDGPEGPPQGIPTFNCIGLYWKPKGGSPQNACTVKYRQKGSEAWREALNLWCDPNEHKGAEEHTLEYRGSIINLKPGTDYEIELSIPKLDLTRKIVVPTWSEDFKIAKRIELPEKQDGTTYVIKEGGSGEKGYVLYDGSKAKWDGQNKTEAQLKVEASWVIIRGLTLVNSKIHGIELMDVNNVVIENCDISGWGQNDPADNYGVNLHSAVYSQSKKLESIVIQNCQLHHPRSDSNSWREVTKTGSKHPRGPQGISFKNGQGRYVVRYNRIFSDLDHMFNDSMGETKNFSYAGFPNRDSDINDNFVSNCWDDGVEIEGADMNVRVWNNYIDFTWGAVGAASPSLGPVYFWRNVYGVSRAGRATDADGYRGHYLFKLGNENLEWVRGKMFIFHNTALQPPAYAGVKEPCGAQSGIVFTSDKKLAHNITSRNNILHTRINNAWAVRDTQITPTNDYDYDMYNGNIKAKKGNEKNGIKAEPKYERTQDGRLWLVPGTPGHDAAVRIPNFNDDFVGKAPDMGAIETGTKEAKPKYWPKFPEPSYAPTK